MVAAAILLVIAAGALAASWGPLRNLFAGYRDGPVSTYVLFGVPWLLVAGVAVAVAVRVLRRR